MSIQASKMIGSFDIVCSCMTYVVILICLNITELADIEKDGNMLSVLQLCSMIRIDLHTS